MMIYPVHSMVQKRFKRKHGGFTLIELLFACVTFSILAGALYGVFSGAMRLNERSYETIERELPIGAALETLRRDLGAMVIPSGTLAGPMTGVADRKNAGSNDTLQFYTASGTLYPQRQAPWGDIQMVNYCLLDPEPPGKDQGKDLAREVTRNLLGSVTPEPEQQRLLSGVRSLEFEYFDGQEWADSWDSTVNEDSPPAVVKVHIEFMNSGQKGWAPRPVDLVCEVAATPKNSEETTSGL